MHSPTNTRHRRLLLSGTVFLAVALTATGCGSREDGSATALEAPAAATDTTATAPDAAAPDAAAPDVAAAGAAAPDVAAAGAAAPDAAAPDASAPDAAAADASAPDPAAPAAGAQGAAAKTSNAKTGNVKTETKTAKTKQSSAAGTAAKGGSAGAVQNAAMTKAGVAPVSDTGGPISIPGTDEQGVSESVIKLGVIAPVSGAAGFLGESEVAAIRAFTSLVNANGGVKGRTYQTIITDSQFEPAQEAQAARKLVDQDKVFALFSVLGDSTGPFVSAKGIPTMVFGLNPPAFSSKYPTTHVTGFSTMDSVTRMAYEQKVRLKKPIKSTAILYDTANIPIAPWVKYLKAAWEAAGVEVKSTDAFNVADGDCTPIVLKMQQLNIDYWQSGQSLNWPACAAAMGRQGWKPKLGFGGPYTSDNKFITQGGPTGMDGAFGLQVGIQVVQSFGQPYNYENNKNNIAPHAKTYVDSLKKYAPNSADTDTLESIWTQTFWIAVQALTQAIESQADAITWKGVNQWFASQKEYHSGLVAPINFDPKCKTGSPVWMYQWKFSKANNRFEQTPWKGYSGPFKVPDAFLNKIVPGAGQCYLTKAADNEL